MDIIGRLWEDSPLFLTRAEFERTLQGCDIEPVEEDGRAIGCFLVKGPEFHYAKFDATPVGKRHLARLAALIEQHGYAVTRTPKDDRRQCRFNEKLGFVKVGEDELDITYRIEKMRGRE